MTHAQAHAADTPHRRRDAPGTAWPRTDEGRQGVIAATWRFRWLSAAVTLLIAGLVVAASLVVGGAPTGTASLALTNATENNLLVPGTIGDSGTARYVNQRADFLTSDEMLERVRDAGADDTVEHLKDRISVSTTTGSNVLKIIVSGDDAASVTDLAETVVETYREMTTEEVAARAQATLETINADVQAAQAQLQAGGASANVAEQTLVELRAQAAGVRIDSASFGDGVDWASIPSLNDVKGPKLTPRDVLVGLALGLVVACFLAWVLADSRRVVSSASHASFLMDSPLLGRISRPSRRASSSPAVSASLALTSRAHRGTVVVVDAGPPSSSASVSGALAAGLALQMRSVLLVDQSEGEGGGIGRLSSGTPIARLTLDTTVDSVKVPTVGASDRLAEFTRGTRDIGSVLRDLEGSFEWVIVDGGAWEDASGAPFLVRAGASVVAVVPQGASEAEVARVSEALTAVEAQVVGVVYLER